MKNLMLISAIVVLSVLLLYQSIFALDVRNVKDFQRAYLEFLKDAAISSCLDKDTIVETAVQRKWIVQDPDPRSLNRTPSENWAYSVRVFVEPPLGFSKVPGVEFSFDEEGCLIRR